LLQRNYASTRTHINHGKGQAEGRALNLLFFQINGWASHQAMQSCCLHNGLGLDWAHQSILTSAGTIVKANYRFAFGLS
jgi:hypothetical protein